MNLVERFLDDVLRSRYEWPTPCSTKIRGRSDFLKSNLDYGHGIGIPIGPLVRVFPMASIDSLEDLDIESTKTFAMETAA
jgi:hypothetical protein